MLGGGGCGGWGGLGGGEELTEIQSGKKQECSERKARAHGQHSRTDRNSRWQLGNDNGEKQKQEP